MLLVLIYWIVLEIRCWRDTDWLLHLLLWRESQLLLRLSLHQYGLLVRLEKDDLVLVIHDGNQVAICRLQVQLSLAFLETLLVHRL